MERQKRHYQHRDLSSEYPFVCKIDEVSVLNQIGSHGLYPYSRLFPIVILSNREHMFFPKKNDLKNIFFVYY